METIELERQNYSEQNTSFGGQKETIDYMTRTDSVENVCDICFVKIPSKIWTSDKNGFKLTEAKSKTGKCLKHCHIQRTQNPFVLNCSICSTVVYDDTISIDTHVNSPYHKRKDNPFHVFRKI